MVNKAAFYLLAALLAAAATIGPAPARAADITARTDRADIGLNESFKLVFQAVGEVDGEPDFTPLEEDFEIVSTSESSSINIVDGRMDRRKTWTLELFPRQTGTLTVPEIAFGSDRSPEIQIEVSRQAAGGGRDNRQDVFIRVEAEPESPYVQQQVLYTVKLFLGVNVANAGLSEPELSNSDAVLRKLGDDREYRTSVNGRNYQVFERRYVIFPQQSGSLTVRPVQFHGTVVTRRRGFFDPFSGSSGQRLRRLSPSVELQVRPVPDNFHGAHWLPAESLTLEQSWSPHPPVFKVGEPVTRTLTVTAGGLTAAQLPELDAPVPAALKRYPDQPALDDEQRAGGVTGRRTEKTALVPTRPGRYTLPPVELTWWNTKTGKPETARLPEQTIEVQPAAGGGGEAPAVPDAAGDAPAPQPAPADAGEPAPAGGGPGLWPWLSLALALAWLATLALWWRQVHGGAAQSHPAAPAPSQPDPKQALRALREACQTNHAENAKQALLAWGRARWPEERIYNLSAVARQVGGEAAERIQQLNDRLYRGTAGDWEGEPLWQAIRDWTPPEDNGDQEGGPLEPLHRI